MSAKRFRKRPVEVEAMQLVGTTEGCNRVLAWIGTHHGAAVRSNRRNPANGIFVNTLEGSVHASAGDWIIRGVAGEFYPCKPDIFEQTYEQVEA